MSWMQKQVDLLGSMVSMVAKGVAYLLRVCV